jgi:gamma-glutamyltranspeptidase/glutathione hydrolase
MTLAPYSTRYAPSAMVATVDHLATTAACGILADGGSAADAAVGASAVLAVTTQHMCGMGGDLLAVVAPPGEPPGALLAAGRAGSGADAERLRADGHATMPFRGDIRSVPVPGCVDGWVSLHDRFGRLPLGRVLAPARRLAGDGFPASPLLARAVGLVAALPEAADYVAGGRLAAGDRVRRPGVARTLDAIAARGRAGFYLGEFGEELLELGAGEFTPADLERVQAEWCEPVHAHAWGHDLYTVPPPSQGYLTLAGALIAEGLPLDAADPGAFLHLLVESAAWAGHDRPAVLHEHADGTALLAPERLDPRRSAIRPDAASRLPAPGAAGGTIHLDVIDADGLAVSLTQSNAAGFGAHIGTPRTRIFLQNRGTGFSLVPGHPAEYGPGRRPPHTLSPALATAGDTTITLGTMGADSQPQVLLQLLARLLVGGDDPGRAVAAPRFFLAGPSGEPFAAWDDPSRLRVRLEGHAPAEWAEALAARGHHVEVVEPFAYGAGHAHVIRRDGRGLAGAADPRALTGAVSGL